MRLPPRGRCEEQVGAPRPPQRRGAELEVAGDAGAVARVIREAGEQQQALLVSSGVDERTIGETLSVADGAIVGTALKVGGVTTAEVDPERVRRLVAAARGRG